MSIYYREVWPNSLCPLPAGYRMCNVSVFEEKIVVFTEHIPCLALCAEFFVATNGEHQRDPRGPDILVPVILTDGQTRFSVVDEFEKLQNSEFVCYLAPGENPPKPNDTEVTSAVSRIRERISEYEARRKLRDEGTNTVAHVE